MSWFDTKSLSKYAKSALVQAQKRIDKALDIKDEDIPSQKVVLPQADEPQHGISHRSTVANGALPSLTISSSPNIFQEAPSLTTNVESDSFFDSFLGDVQRHGAVGGVQRSPKREGFSTLEKASEVAPFLRKTSFSNPKDCESFFNAEDKNILEHLDSQSGKANQALISVDPESYSYVSGLTDIVGSSGDVCEKVSALTDSRCESPMSYLCTENGDLGPNAVIDQNLILLAKSDFVATPMCNPEENACSLHSVSVPHCHGKQDQLFVDSMPKDHSIHSESLRVVNLPLVGEHLTEIMDENKGSESCNMPVELLDGNFSPRKDFEFGSGTAHEQIIHQDVINTVFESQVFLSEKGMLSVILEDESKVSQSNSYSDGKIKDSLQKSIDTEAVLQSESYVACSPKMDSKPSLPLTDKNEAFFGSQESLVITKLQKELSTLNLVLQARENKLVVLSKENIDLQEAVSIYKSQIEQLEQTAAVDDTEIQAMTSQFTARISESEKKCQSAIKERDALRERMAKTEESLTRRAEEKIFEMQQLLVDREEKIKGLLEEGEKLSKIELEGNNRLKKYRAKVKDLTCKNDAQSKKMESLVEELQAVKSALKEKEASEKKLEGEVKKLEMLTDQQEDELSSLKEKLDDLEERHKAMESTLTNAYAEINDLSFKIAQKESETLNMTAAVEQKKEMEEKLKDFEKKAKYGKEELIGQLEDLQAAYTRLEQLAARKEESLKQEISDLRQSLEAGDARNQELSHSVTAATRPLLRQIEYLQISHSNQAENWERVERALTERLTAMQHQTALASEKERSASEIALELRSKAQAMEATCGALKQEKLKLEKAVEKEAAKVRELEEQLSREVGKLEKELSRVKKLCDGLQNEKAFLEQQFAAEKLRCDTEIMQLSSQITSQTRQPLSRQSSTASLTGEERLQATPLDLSLLKHRRTPSSSSSTHDSLPTTDYNMKTATTASIERLQSMLRKRDGELYVCQEEIRTLEQTKASLAQELVNLSNRNEELELDSNRLKELTVQYQDLQSRYNAVLQMYGEKAEEVEELKLDLQDIKQMYRQQIQDLLSAR